LAESAEARPSKPRPEPAGGRLSRRVLAAVVFLPAFVWITLRGGIPYLVFVEAVLLLGTREILDLLDRLGLRARRECVFPAVLLMPLALARGVGGLALLLGAAAVVALVGALAARARPLGRVLAASLLALAYPGLFGAFLSALRGGTATIPPDLSGFPVPFGAGAVFLLFLATWGCDTAAFFVGRAVGRRPLAPALSPRKTWEGAAGGLAAALAAGALAGPALVPYLSRPEGLLVGGVLGVLGQIGDLVESGIKRAADVKDASNAIPGHGGVLDRFDGILVNAPVLYSLLVILSGAGPAFAAMLE
jgi:phosphatidate cytidylyltransferase